MNMRSILRTILYLICINIAELKTIEENGILPRELVDKFENNRSNSFIININDFADQIFVNLQQLLVSRNLNSIALPNATLKLKPTGKLDLTAGYLQDLETISRNGDINISYEHTNRRLSFDISIQFGDLRFSYNFHSKVTAISSHGVVNGTVKNIKVNAEVSFDFETYQAALDHYDMKHTGDIHVKFHGNKIFDWLLDAMTKVFTVFFHPLIVGQIQKLIRDNLRMIVEKLNEIMHQNIDPTMI